MTGLTNGLIFSTQYFRFPRSPKYLYSLIGDTPTDSFWLFHVSYWHQIILCSFSFAAVLLYAFINIMFANSMIGNLLALSGTNSSSIKSKLHNLHTWRVHNFFKLQTLMNSFNEIFKWQVFIQMSGVVLLVCFTIYIPLRYWNVIEIFSSCQLVTFALLLIYTILWGFFPLMGQVLEKSEKFQSEMKMLMLLAQESDNSWVSEPDKKIEYKQIMIRVSLCRPFGFKGGSFCTFKAGTLLTVFYSIITHIIIILQLDW